jgi:hypothetical protein
MMRAIVPSLRIVANAAVSILELRLRANRGGRAVHVYRA